MAPTPPPLVAPFEVLAVTDTRDFIEVGDRWVPVPGSGDPHQCERCERVHEIHATVRDATGRTAIVGTGCMDADTGQARRLAAGATRAAKTAARAAAARAAADQLEQLTAAAAALDFPAHTRTEAPGLGGKGYAWTVGDATVYGRGDHDPAERMDCLERNWRDKRLAELAGGRDALDVLRRRAGDL